MININTYIKMISFNDYILEKLKINKNVTSVQELTEHDDAVRIYIDFTDYDVKVHKIHIAKDITHNKITYNKYLVSDLDRYSSQDKEGVILDDTINYTIEEPGHVSIILQLKDAVDFITELLKLMNNAKGSIAIIPPELIQKYTGYKFNLSTSRKFHIYCNYIPDISDIKQDILHNYGKAITEKLHISKETNSELSEGDDAIMLNIDKNDDMISIRKIHIDDITPNIINYHKYKRENPNVLTNDSYVFGINKSYKTLTDTGDPYSVSFMFTIKKGIELINAILNMTDGMSTNTGYFDIPKFNLKSWIDYDKNEFPDRYIRYNDCGIINNIKISCEDD